MRIVWFTGVWILLAAGASVAMAQRQGTGSAPPIQQPGPPRTNFPPMGGISPMPSMDASGAPDILNSRIVEQQARSRNSERQKRLQADTDKLVGLVDELKQQLQGEKELSPADVGKRAEEIEKLARSVKDKMKG